MINLMINMIDMKMVEETTNMINNIKIFKKKIECSMNNILNL